MKTLVLHASSFDECWAHYYFWSDPDFHRRLRERGYELVRSKDASPEAVERAAAVVYLEAFSAGAGRETRWAKLGRKLAARLRAPGIPPAGRYDPGAHARPFALHGPGHPARFDARGRPRVLLALEGVMHAPDNYNPEARRHFDRILTWNDALLEPGRTVQYRVPQAARWPAVAPPPFAARKWLASISANKRVKHPLELYTERRRALARLARAIPEQFDFYGMGWEGTRLARSPCYRGEAKDKAEIYARHRFALVYENAQVPGYVSEKIFDAMRSGCVPVYLGAPNVATYVPAECFVDRRRFASDRELAGFLGTVTEAEHARRLAAIRAYLEGDGFRPFLVTSFADAFAEAADGVRA
jgi:hypothetical protein